MHHNKDAGPRKPDQHSAHRTIGRYKQLTWLMPGGRIVEPAVQVTFFYPVTLSFFIPVSKLTKLVRALFFPFWKESTAVKHMQ